VTEPLVEALVIGVHHDDCDFNTAGISALWIKDGKRVVWVVMTDGAEGYDVPEFPDTELIRIREAEQLQAASLIGVENVEFLRYPDGHLFSNDETRKSIVRLIRKYRPRIICTHAPLLWTSLDNIGAETSFIGGLNHPDHRETGHIVLDALFPFALNPRAYRDLLEEGLLPYRVHEVFLFSTEHPNTHVDIGQVIETKIAYLQCHVSQYASEKDLPDQIRSHATYLTHMYTREIPSIQMSSAQFVEVFQKTVLYTPED
jgi:LmbE family N-acetylglucosaminyl deacetylase